MNVQAAINSQGFYPAIRALLNRLFRYLCLFLTLPFALLLFIVRPVVLIRLRKIHTERIGHIAVEYILYSLKKEMSFYPNKAVDIFYTSGQISNPAILEIISRNIRVIQSAAIICMFSYLEKWIDFFSFMSVHKIDVSYPDGNKFLLSVRPDIADVYQLHFSTNEHTKAHAMMKGIGLDEVAPYVCFYNRDSTYLSSRYPDSDWSSHDIRDNDIVNYNLAAAKLVEKNYFVVRLGEMVEKRIPLVHENVIDYAASNNHNHLLDIYLIANSSFFVGVLGGVVSVAVLFKKPLVCVDVVNLSNIFRYDHSPSIMIPKKFWLNSENRFLTFGEHILMSQNELSSLVQSGELIVHDNSAEEIADVVTEMTSRMESTWSDSDEDKENQANFRALFSENVMPPGIELDIRIGAKFLSDNKALIH